MIIIIIKKININFPSFYSDFYCKSTSINISNDTNGNNSINNNVHNSNNILVIIMIIIIVIDLIIILKMSRPACGTPAFTEHKNLFSQINSSRKTTTIQDILVVRGSDKHSKIFDWFS